MSLGQSWSSEFIATRGRVGFCCSPRKSLDDPERAEWAQEYCGISNAPMVIPNSKLPKNATALENVLVPETPEDHVARLRKAGFATVRCWFQTLNFMAWIAIKWAASLTVSHGNSDGWPAESPELNQLAEQVDFEPWLRHGNAFAKLG